MKTGLAGLAFKGHHLIKVDKVIQASDFNSMQELSTLIPNDAPDIIPVTSEAWHKYEAMLLTPDELAKFVPKEAK